MFAAACSFLPVRIMNFGDSGSYGLVGCFELVICRKMDRVVPAERQRTGRRSPHRVARNIGPVQLARLPS
jgi:hypothetical protein